MTAVIVAKVLQFGLSPRGVLKEGELYPGVLSKKSHQANGNGSTTSTANGNGSTPHIGNGNGVAHVTTNGSVIVKPSKSSFLPKWCLDVLDVCFSMRGYGWKFGHGVHRPKDPRPMERGAFLRATFYALIKAGLFVDLTESALKLFPGIRDEQGGSFFFAELPFFRRYLVSTVLNIMTGQALCLGIEGFYEMFTIVAVGLFDSDPNEWPPVMDSPFLSESLHGIWARNWHQLLRQTFIVMGGIPGGYIGGNVGMVLGTFLASGLYHEIAIQAMGRGWDWMPVLFFAIQGPLLILERLWRSVTGRRVGGWIGRLWVYLVLLGGAQIMSSFSYLQRSRSCLLMTVVANSWLERGLGGGMMIPPAISPTRQILFPLLGMQNLVDRYVFLPATPL